MVSDHGLWIHQESAVISAESHDIWRFTPEFLVESEIVPDSWICRTATQSSDEVTILIGPSRWVMTPRNLWITTYPDRSLKDDTGDVEGSHTPSLTRKFLEAVPYLPSRKLWLFWRISAVIPDRDQWMLETFLNKNWPSELGDVVIQPRLTVVVDDLTIRVTIRNEGFRQQEEAHGESTAFDCYVSRGSDQAPREMYFDISQSAERLQMLERIIEELLGSRN